MFSVRVTKIDFKGGGPRCWHVHIFYKEKSIYLWAKLLFLRSAFAGQQEPVWNWRGNEASSVLVVGANVSSSSELCEQQT